MNNVKLLCAAIVLGLVAANPVSDFKTCKILVIDIKGASVPLYLEIADTAPLRERGLMHRKKLAVSNGMLFIFDRTDRHSFWMKNTLIPLSIAFIDKKGTINEIYDMNPLDTSFVTPKQAARYALEVNRGWFREKDITIGCKILPNGCFGK